MNRREAAVKGGRDLRSLTLAESSSGGSVLNKLMGESKIALIGVYSLKAEPTIPNGGFI
jgi:hypothetical protein